MKYITPILLAVALIGLVTAPSPRPIYADPRPDPEIEAMGLINELRVSVGLVPLAVSEALIVSARRHSTDMGLNNTCGHIGTDGSTSWSRMVDAGYTGIPWSEVIACGYSSVSEAVEGLWNSPGHFAVLTSTDITDVGCSWYEVVNGPGRGRGRGRGYIVGWLTCDVGQAR